MPIQTSNIFDQLGYKLTGTCSCGRMDSIIHCPYCGSTGVIVLKRLSKENTVMLTNGSRVADKVFTCKMCSKNFPESACFRTCAAMPLTWQRESEVVKHVVSSGATLPESQMEVLRHLAKKNPRHAEKIKAKLGSAGLLEKHEQERLAQTNTSDIDVTKLFEPPKLDEGDKS